MGTNSSHFHPPSSHLHVVLNYQYCKVWVRKIDKKEQMEEYRVSINNNDHLEKYKKMF